MKRVTVTWTESTRETRTFEVDDDWQERDVDGTMSSAAEALITGEEGHSQSFAVEERDVLEVTVDQID